MPPASTCSSEWNTRSCCSHTPMPKEISEKAQMKPPPMRKTRKSTIAEDNLHDEQVVVVASLLPPGYFFPPRRILFVGLDTLASREELV